MNKTTQPAPSLPDPTYSGYLAKQQEYDRALAMQTASRFGMGTLLGGAAAGGLFGLNRWLNRPSVTQGPVDYTPEDLDIGYPVEPKRKKRGLLGMMRPTYQKQADEPYEVAPVYRRISKAISKAPEPSLSGEGAPPQGFLGKAWQLGNEYPWAGPLGIAMGMGGGYGGYQLANRLSKSRRDAEREAEMDTAKKEYESALLGQYSRPFKTAEETSSLDKLYDAYEKKGFLWGLDPASAYATYAAATSLPMALYGYKRFKSTTDKSLEAALRRRAALRALESPSDMYLHPQPVEVPPEEEERKRKRAPL